MGLFFFYPTIFFVFIQIFCYDEAKQCFLRRGAIMIKKRSEINQIEMLKSALDTIDSMIAIKDIDGNYLYVNKAVDEYYKNRYDTIIGKNYREIYPLSEQAVVKQLDDEVIQQEKTVNKVIEVYTDEGFIYVDSSRAPIFDADNNIIGVISAGKNVTENELLKKELEELNKKYYTLAYMDVLTEIGNRRKFYHDFLELKGKDFHTLVILDLNNFKKINDELGHSRGDEVLHQFAQLLQTIAINLNGQAYRLGGDEFTLLLPEDASFNSHVQRLNEHLTKQHPNVTLSYGETTIDTNQTIDTVYRDFCINRVDELLYQYKYQTKK